MQGIHAVILSVRALIILFLLREKLQKKNVRSCKFNAGTPKIMLELQNLPSADNMVGIHKNILFCS